MLPKINPKQLEKIAKKIGMEMENIDAEKVVIECPNKKIEIINPVVSRIKMGEQESFQVVGEVKERSKFSEEDIEIVAEKANISRTEAAKLLEETGDIALAIKKVKK